MRTTLLLLALAVLVSTPACGADPAPTPPPVVPAPVTDAEPAPVAPPPAEPTAAADGPAAAQVDGAVLPEVRYYKISDG